jgi:urease accessory protein UreF
MWKTITTWFNKTFSYSEQSQLEQYLATQEIHNNVDLEHYMKLFEEKQRRMSKMWYTGDMAGYRHEQLYY